MVLKTSKKNKSESNPKEEINKVNYLKVKSNCNQNSTLLKKEGIFFIVLLLRFLKQVF